MTSPARPTGTLSVAAANLQYGGLSESGDGSAWAKSMACLRRWAPDVLLVQEMNGRAAWRLHAHLWRTARELGMTPVLGPPMPDSVSGNHTAVFVRTTAGLMILDAGPPPGTVTSSWCEALVAVPGIGHPVWLISVHLPARSLTSAHVQAERLANLIAHRGGLVIAGGDWNGYADPIAPDVLQALPAHLRPARMRTGPGGQLAPDFHVHQVLAAVGLGDAAAGLLPGQRTPPELTPTGITGGARVDRIYLTRSLIPAVDRYQQQPTGGSDHQALLLTISLARAAATTPPGPLP